MINLLKNAQGEQRRRICLNIVSRTAARAPQLCSGDALVAEIAGNLGNRIGSSLFTRYFTAAILGALVSFGSLQAAVLERKGAYQSGGRKIVVEVYQPAESGAEHPALIVLHGSGGVLFPGFNLRQQARQLAAEGYATFFVHYLNRTGHFMVRHKQVHQNLDTWTDTVRDGISYVAQQPGVDAKRIGVMGHSLGAYVGLKLASEDSRIKVVIDASGALDKQSVKRMPPTLILHGAGDKTVPVAKAYRLGSLLKGANAPYQMHIYPEEAHIYSRAAIMDASKRIQIFLSKHLRA